MELTLDRKSEVFKKIAKDIRKANKEFAGMSKTKQRTTIARDVIKMLGGGDYDEPDEVTRIEPRSTYLMLPDGVQQQLCEWAGDQPDEVVEKIDTAHVLAQLPTCDVCGIGSLFVAAVLRHDQLPINNLINGLSCDTRSMEVDYLSEWFDRRDLDKVEFYFENHNAYSKHPIRKAETKRQRMIMIMENIISNRGRFRPKHGKHSSKQK